ncbi:hypothetical protein EYF80_063144 [Liparis tanakae]|uniref:Uncharacterized protein n=1 Tax=Liparis tanakae TaxID=230148 RepID=A0A4Z2ECT7_9TELE|nr:hypothetical protein EYF80_063144 [Liparis tanakae]
MTRHPGAEQAPQAGRFRGVGRRAVCPESCRRSRDLCRNFPEKMQRGHKALPSERQRECIRLSPPPSGRASEARAAINSK